MQQFELIKPDFKVAYLIKLFFREEIRGGFIKYYSEEAFAHGYLVIELSIVSYECAEKFYAEYDSGVRYDEPSIGVNWPFDEIDGIVNLIVGRKDKMLGILE